MRFQSSIIINHPSGPIEVVVFGGKATVVAHVSNVIKERFDQEKAPTAVESPVTNAECRKDRHFYDFLRDFFGTNKRS